MHRVYPHQVWPHDGASYQSLRRAAPRPAFSPIPTLVSPISSRLLVLSAPWKRLPTISDFHLLSLGQPSVLRAAFFTADHSVFWNHILPQAARTLRLAGIPPTTLVSGAVR